MEGFFKNICLIYIVAFIQVLTEVAFFLNNK